MINRPVNFATISVLYYRALPFIMAFFVVPTEWSSTHQIGLSAASGLISRLCFYIYGEHHMKAPFLLRLYVLFF